MDNKYISYDVIIIGAGAAGLMAASIAGKCGKKVLLIEHSDKIGEKIRISGGGRCNFTNIYAKAENYLSNNPHFIKSALSGYSQHDFIKLIEEYKISYHEKTLGQLFCDKSSMQIIEMLLNECKKYNVEIITNCKVDSVTKDNLFYLETNIEKYECKSLIIASGGLSIPKLNSSDFGYKIAKQFNINIIPTRPALVPLTLDENNLAIYKQLSGISISSITHYKKTSFNENILFTHKGLSGPAILQISSYISSPNNETININLSPNINVLSALLNSKSQIDTALKSFLPARFVEAFCQQYNIDKNKKIIEFKKKDLELIASTLHNFPIKLFGTEGYAKAEVTSGGIDTNELSSKTMEAKKVPGLYFIGEVVDVTGWLGGYNFQWAWSSGFAAGSFA